MLESESADVDALLDEIARDLPDWKWTLWGDSKSATAQLTADGFVRVSTCVGGTRPDMPATALRSVIAAAKRQIARRAELPVAEVFLLSYERRQRGGA